jgi:hypothetical protein
LKLDRRIQLTLESLEERWLPSVFTVTSTADSGTGSLRAALTAAVSGDTIGFALPNPSTIHLTSGSLNVPAGVTILGPGASALTIQGNGQFSDFFIQSSAAIVTTSISGLTMSGGGGNTGGGIDNSYILKLNNCVVTNNSVTSEGGGIENTGILYMTGCMVSNNTAVTLGGGINSIFNTTLTVTGSTITGNTLQGVSLGARGGGIYSDGPLAVINSTISLNNANGAGQVGGMPGTNGEGGGLYSASDGSCAILSCTFFENAAEGGNTTDTIAGAGAGGGVFVANSAEITNCTFSQNAALGGNSALSTGGDGLGGGLAWTSTNASPTVVDCTIVGNSADAGGGHTAGASSMGGGILTGGSGTLENSIIATNGAFSGGPDIFGNLTTALADLVGNGSGSNVMVGGEMLNQVGSPGSPIDPLLGPLQNNGGPTQTMMPMPNSTAIDRGNNAFLETTVDQRGDARVVDGVVDIGAIEVQKFRRIAVGPGAGMPPQVKEYDPVNGILKLDFMAYETTFMGGVRVAVGDINGDGVPDIITAPAGVQVTLVNVNGALMPSFNFSAGRAPEIKVFSGTDGSKIADFLAYPSNFTAGVFVAVADVNHDGKLDIITGPDATGQPGHTNVRVFFNNSLINTGVALTPDLEFNAYDPGFGGGVRVAAADLNRDGFADIVTGPGIWSGPDIRIFDGKTLANSHTVSKIGEFLAYDFRYFGGVFVSTGDTNGDGFTDVITGTNGNGGPEVKAFSGANALTSPTPTIIDDFFAYAPAFNGGASVAALDVNGDGKADIITGAGSGGGPHVRIFDGGTGLQLQGNTSDSFFAYDAIFSGGVYVGAGEGA